MNGRGTVGTGHECPGRAPLATAQGIHARAPYPYAALEALGSERNCQATPSNSAPKMMA